MPLYEYQCKQCGHRFEKIQSFSAPEEKECPECKGEVERLISAPAFQFKGAGWYVNDYAPKSGAKAAAGEEKGAGGEASAGSPQDSKSGSEGSQPTAPASGETSAAAPAKNTASNTAAAPSSTASQS